jgi:hypothetical protein
MNLFTKLVISIFAVGLLFGCNVESKVSPASSSVAKMQKLDFVSPEIDHLGIRDYYFSDLIGGIERGFTKSYNQSGDEVRYSVLDIDGGIEKSIDLNQLILSSKSLSDLHSDYETLIMSIKVNNYRKFEMDLNPIDHGLKPDYDYDGLLDQILRTQSSLAIQMNNLVLESTLGKESLFDKNTLDPHNSADIEKVKNYQSSLLLTNADLIEISKKHGEIFNMAASEDVGFWQTLRAYISHDLYKLRLQAMANDDPNLTEAQKYYRNTITLKNKNQYFDPLYK